MSTPPNNTAILRFVKITEQAKTPARGSAQSAGLDLYSAYDTTVPARGRSLISTGLKIQLPPGSYGRIAPRSGLALRHHIDIGGGVIDEDYRGELSVIIFNHSDIPVAFLRADRIAQLICQPVCYAALEVNALDVTERGDGGFGSTGD
jgi:dUTP pyrophosphatase